MMAIPKHATKMPANAAIASALFATHVCSFSTWKDVHMQKEKYAMAMQLWFSVTDAPRLWKVVTGVWDTQVKAMSLVVFCNYHKSCMVVKSIS
jgi:hypothetical protein